MKTPLIILFLILIISHSAFAQKNGNLVPPGSVKKKGANATWESTSHDFGTITQGVPVSVTFKFTNEGSAPLIISDVKSSCGCTTPFYTTDPILPGKTGIIRTQYNAANLGDFEKSITVITNSTVQPEILLFIKGNVVK